MDADDYAFPYRLAEQVRFMQENHNVSVCGGALRLYERPEEIWTAPLSHEDICATMLFNSAIFHPTAIYRRNVALAVGGYDVSSPFAEDYELWFKMGSKEGGLFANISSVLLKYRTHNGRSDSYQNKIDANANKVRKNFLNKIGLMPSQKEWEAHFFLSNGNKILSISEMYECRHWILKIIKASKALLPSLHQAIINEVCQRWRRLFALQNKRSLLKCCVFLETYLRLLYLKYIVFLRDSTNRGR